MTDAQTVHAAILEVRAEAVYRALSGECLHEHIGEDHDDAGHWRCDDCGAYVTGDGTVVYDPASDEEVTI